MVILKNDVKSRERPTEIVLCAIMIFVKIQVERGHHKFDLPSSFMILRGVTCRRLCKFCPDVNGSPVILVLYDMIDDGRLHLAGYQQLCRPDASPGVFCSCL